MNAIAPLAAAAPPGSALRLGVALLASAGLHLWLMYGVTVVAPQPSVAAGVLTARLAPPPEPATRLEAGAPPVERAVPVVRAKPPVERSAMEGEARSERATLVPAPAAPTGLPPVEMPMLADLTWYPARQLDVYPRLVALVQPRYPAQADAQGLKGSVTLLIHIDENGLAREVDVVEAEPVGFEFEQAALEAYGEARWVPAVKNARYVRSRVLVRVTFEPAPGPQALNDD